MDMDSDSDVDSDSTFTISHPISQPDSQPVSVEEAVEFNTNQSRENLLRRLLLCAGLVYQTPVEECEVLADAGSPDARHWGQVAQRLRELPPVLADGPRTLGGWQAQHLLRLARRRLLAGVTPVTPADNHRGEP
jgi:hypothetical protein